VLSACIFKSASIAHSCISPLKNIALWGCQRKDSLYFLYTGKMAEVLTY
jgi:hypothetical protein